MPKKKHNERQNQGKKYRQANADRGHGDKPAAVDDSPRPSGCNVPGAKGCLVGEPIPAGATELPAGAVKMTCDSGDCPAVPYVHAECFERFVDELVDLCLHRAATGRTHSWTEKFTRANLWSYKVQTIPVIHKECRCPHPNCNGHVLFDDKAARTEIAQEQALKNLENGPSEPKTGTAAASSKAHRGAAPGASCHKKTPMTRHKMAMTGHNCPTEPRPSILNEDRTFFGESSAAQIPVGSAGWYEKTYGKKKSPYSTPPANESSGHTKASIKRSTSTAASDVSNEVSSREESPCVTVSVQAAPTHRGSSSVSKPQDGNDGRPAVDLPTDARLNGVVKQIVTPRCGLIQPTDDAYESQLVIYATPEDDELLLGDLVSFTVKRLPQPRNGCHYVVQEVDVIDIDSDEDDDDGDTSSVPMSASGAPESQPAPRNGSASRSGVTAPAPSAQQTDTQSRPAPLPAQAHPAPELFEMKSAPQQFQVQPQQQKAAVPTSDQHARSDEYEWSSKAGYVYEPSAPQFTGPHAALAPAPPPGFSALPASPVSQRFAECRSPPPQPSAPPTFVEFIAQRRQAIACSGAQVEKPAGGVGRGRPRYRRYNTPAAHSIPQDDTSSWQPPAPPMFG